MSDHYDGYDPIVHKMVLVATLYYKEKLSQQEIAQRLQLSRPWVSKLLARAEESGIVKIDIVPPYSNNEVLARELAEKYDLQYAHVSAADGGQDALAQAAANYFIDQLREKDVVGVGWGTSVSRLIEQIAPAAYPQVQVVPLAGSFGNSISYFPNFSALRLAEAIGASACVLHTPALCASQEEYDTLLANDAPRSVLRLAQQSDILLVGIGAFADSISPKYGVFGEADIEALRQAEAIGDVALQYLDRRGEPVDIPFTRRLIKADIFQASANARVSLGIAAGLHKVAAIHAALRLHLVNTLFTDERTALALLGG
jgi:DNA-binding transcriptional regulator LsrR (DeoR family)